MGVVSQGKVDDHDDEVDEEEEEGEQTEENALDDPPVKRVSRDHLERTSRRPKDLETTLVSTWYAIGQTGHCSPGKEACLGLLFHR